MTTKKKVATAEPVPLRRLVREITSRVSALEAKDAKNRKDIDTVLLRSTKYMSRLKKVADKSTASLNTLSEFTDVLALIGKDLSVLKRKIGFTTPEMDAAEKLAKDIKRASIKVLFITADEPVKLVLAASIRELRTMASMLGVGIKTNTPNEVEDKSMEGIRAACIENIQNLGTATAPFAELQTTLSRRVEVADLLRAPLQKKVFGKYGNYFEMAEDAADFASLMGDTIVAGLEEEDEDEDELEEEDASVDRDAPDEDFEDEDGE